MDDIYKNLEEYNLDKESKTLFVFDDMITDMLIKKKLHSIVTELFIRGRKSNISLIFTMQSHFVVLKNIRLYFTQYLIRKY